MHLSSSSFPVSIALFFRDIFLSLSFSCDCRRFRLSLSPPWFPSGVRYQQVES